MHDRIEDRIYYYQQPMKFIRRGSNSYYYYNNNTLNLLLHVIEFVINAYATDTKIRFLKAALYIDKIS
jgi:hypothetical protein